MVILRTVLCEGAEKGKLAEERTQRAFQIFFAPGVIKIEAKCNKRRDVLLAEWRTKDPRAYMLECNLPTVTYRRGIWEANPPFELYEPRQIELCIYETVTYPNNPRTAMAMEKLDEERKMLRLHVFLKNFRNFSFSFSEKEKPYTRWNFV